jgi:hypothetical protein
MSGIEPTVAAADTDSVLTVNRVLVLALVAAAAFGIWRIALPAEQQAADATGDAAVSLLDTRTDARFTVAQANLQTQLQTTGSFAGAAMPPGATLVRADAASYCVQVGPPGAVSHLTGPGAVSVAGPC